MRRPVSALATALSLLTAASGCTHHDSYVGADQAALGRVVIYRNGIAYYERHAKVDGDTLTLRVPADKIDDFLKSLTVADAKTGTALPISFPSPGKSRGGEVEMTIQLPDRSHHDILLSYVTESPAWKPSYRVVVSDAGKVDLQGWAVVDNTSGEDWKAVQVGVGSSSALSFRFDLRTVRLVHRETLESQETFAKAPPTGGSTYREAGEDGKVLGELADGEIPRPVGHPDLTLDTVAAADEKDKGGKRERTGDTWKQDAKKTPQKMAEEARIDKLADSLNRGTGTIMIDQAHKGDGRAEDGPQEAALLKAPCTILRAHTRRIQ